MIHRACILFNRKVFLLNKNRSAEARTASAGNHVATAHQIKFVIICGASGIKGAKRPFDPNIMALSYKEDTA